MIRVGEKIFVDTGAWVALAESKDPLHGRAVTLWETLGRAGARIITSVPVVLETFTFLDRRGSRELALRWQSSLRSIKRFQILPCLPAQFEEAWQFLERKEFHELSLVDATSFVLMQKHDIRVALAFDTHFVIAGFRLPS